MRVEELSSEEFNSYYTPYIQRANAMSLQDGLISSGEDTIALYESISEEQFNYRYAEGKWTIKELLQHIIDTERIFAYRALRIARRDKTVLAGFEQDDYAVNSGANKKTGAQLLAEYKAVRLSTSLLFEGFSEDDLKAIGTASGSAASTRAIGFIIIGHEKHHNMVVKERYL